MEARVLVLALSEDDAELKDSLLILRNHIVLGGWGSGRGGDVLQGKGGMLFRTQDHLLSP